MQVELLEFIMSCIVAMIEISPVNPQPEANGNYGAIAAMIAIACIAIFLLWYDKTKLSNQTREDRIYSKIVAAIIGIIIFVGCLILEYYLFVV